MAAPQVPFVDLGRQYAGLREEILATIDGVMKSGQYILGPEVEAFETEAAAFCGVKHAIGVANGSDSLWLSLKCLGVGPGDEVITAPNSFIASAWSIAAVGATPVFSDVDTSFNLDPGKLAQAITPRTKAIMPVHLTGRIADMDAILAIAARHKLPVIEDAAQAIGATRGGKSAGAFGVVGSFSLHPLKNLAAFGNGGLVVTNNDAIAAKLRLLRNHGLKTRDESVLWGYNSRLDAVQAAVLRIKLRRLADWNKTNRALAARYNAALKDLVKVPEVGADEEPIYHRYVIQTDRRDALQRFLAEGGIDTKVNYPTPIHLQEVAAPLGHGKGAFPVAERLAGTILSLPLYPEFTHREQDMVIDGITAFFPHPAMNAALPNDPSLRLVRDMLRIRMVEEAIAREYPKGEMRCPVHLSVGQEAVAIGVGSALERTDPAVSTHRAHAHYLAKGGDLKRFLAELFGKEAGCARGRGGSMHLIDLDVGFEGSTAIVGSTLPVGVGLALGAAVRGESAVTCIFLGDGAVEEGVFTESANFAAVRKLPVIFICENNDYSVYSPINVRQPKGRKIHELVRAIGLTTSAHDGNDVFAVSATAKSAVADVRAGKGPMLLEFATYRWLEHCGPYPDDNLGYRPETDVAAWKARDPIRAAEEKLKGQRGFGADTMERWRAEIAAEIDAAFDFARTAPWPDVATRGEYVYA